MEKDAQERNLYNTELLSGPPKMRRAEAQGKLWEDGRLTEVDHKK